MFMKKNLYPKERLNLRFLPNALLMPHVGYVTAENYSVFHPTDDRRVRYSYN